MSDRDDLLDRLSKSETEPLLPWRDFEAVMVQMEEFCTTEAAAFELIERFGPTRSAAHAVALCGTLVHFTDRDGEAPRIEVLLRFFKVCRFRCHLGLMGDLLSKVNYILQRSKSFIEDQEALFELCIAGLEMCEQMSQDHWYQRWVEDPLLRIELIVQFGLSPETRRSTQGVLLQSLLERAKQMLVETKRTA